MGRRLACWIIAALVLRPLLLRAQGEGDRPEARLATAPVAVRMARLVRETTANAENEPKKAVVFGNEALGLLADHPDRGLEALVSNDLATAYAMLGDYEKALAMADRANRLAETRGDGLLQSRAERNLANAHLRLNRYDRALDHAGRALALARSAGARLDEARAVRLTGIVYDELGEYPRALTSYLEAQRAFEALGSWKDVASTLNNVGIVYQKTKDFDHALDCYSRALTVEQKMGEKRAVSNTLNNIGVVHFDRKNYPAALEYYLRALDIERDLGSDWGIGIALANIAEAEEKLGRTDAALEHYRQALALSRKAADQWGVATVLKSVGTIHAAQGRFDLASGEIEQALAIAREIKAREVVRDCLQALAEMREKQGNDAVALALYKEYAAVRDEILSEEGRKAIAESRSRFEIASREAEIELLRRDSAIKELALRKGRLQTGALLAVTVLLAALALLGGVAYRNKARATAVIRAQNEALAEAARTDPLTGLSNRRHFTEMAELELARVARSPRPFVLVLSDIDDFKAVNDRHGHDAGDTVLRRVAEVMRGQLRELDVVGRWGGEEFIWLLPETDLDGGIAVTERVRLAIAASRVVFSSAELVVSMTFGVAERASGEPLETCIARADAALYAGKDAGKGRVVAAPPFTVEGDDAGRGLIAGPC
jgi:diguanylate cyclase (GGDEF)-like protein